MTPGEEEIQFYTNTVTVSPDGSLCASGDKAGQAMLWDLNEGKALSHLDAQSTINDLCFSPNRYWLCAATDQGDIRIWDLESKQCVAELTLDEEDDFPSNKRKPKCNCICWSGDGSTLYAGYSDSVIRVWKLMRLTRELRTALLSCPPEKCLNSHRTLSTLSPFFPE